MSESTLSTIGFVESVEGTTYPLVSSGEAAGSGPSGKTINSGGVIFTELEMPKLEEMLESYRVRFAVLERPAPNLSVANVEERGRQPARTIAWWRLVLAVALAAGVFVTGALLLVAVMVSSPLRPNPYVALALFLGGLGLLATVATALRGSDTTIA